MEQEPHSLSGHGSTGWFSAQLERPFPLSYCLLLQRNLWKWKHSHERTVGSESFQPLSKGNCCLWNIPVFCGGSAASHLALLAKGISCLLTPTPWNLHLQQLQGLYTHKSHTR